MPPIARLKSIPLPVPARAAAARMRSLDRDLDSRIELEMRTDHKELSEHLMLVDLARNDPCAHLYAG